MRPAHFAAGWALEQSIPDRDAKFLLYVICNHINLEWETWYSQEVLSNWTNIPVRTLRRKLAYLVEIKAISIEERRRLDGTKTSSLITVKCPEAKMGEGVIEDQPPARNGVSHRPETGLATGQYMAEQDSSKNLNELRESSASPPRKRKLDRPDYTELFEEKVWKPYPKKDGSKKNAFQKFQRLCEEDQKLVISTIPVYAAKRAGEDPKYTKHLEFYISDRRFDMVGVSQAAAAAGATGPEGYSRRQWEEALKFYRKVGNWSRHWGPAPDEPGCLCPEGLLFMCEKYPMNRRFAIGSTEREMTVEQYRAQESVNGGLTTADPACDNAGAGASHGGSQAVHRSIT